MLIPKLLYGRHDDVQRLCENLWKQVVQLGSFQAIFDGGEYSDPLIGNELLLLGKPDMLLRKKNTYVLHALHYLMVRKAGSGEIDGELELALFKESLKTPWGTLGLTSNFVGSSWAYRHSDWCGMYMQSIVNHWDEIVEVGARYASDLVDSGSFWEVPTIVGPVLGFLGVPDEAVFEYMKNGLVSVKQWL